MANAAARMAAEKQKAVEEAIRQAEEGPLPGGAPPDGALAAPGEGLPPAQAPPDNAPRSVFSPKADGATYTPEEMSVSTQEEPPPPSPAPAKKRRKPRALKPRRKAVAQKTPAAPAAERAQPKAPPKPEILVPLTPVTPANP